VKSNVLEVFNPVSITEVINLNFDVEFLEVTISVDGENIDVIFEEPAGFRVLDEGDLLEFWPDCSMSVGWLHEITSGGWFDLEKNRSGFLSSDSSDIIEYLIVGVNYCVSILAWEKPRVQQSTR